MSRDPSAPEHRRLLLDSIRDYLSQLTEEGLEGLPTNASVTQSLLKGPASDSSRVVKGPVEPVAPVVAPPAPAAPAAAAIPGDPARAQPSPPSQPVPPGPGELLSRYPGLEKTKTLEDVSAFIGECKRCKLAPLRTHLVFGVGNPAADLMFVGE